MSPGTLLGARAGVVNVGLDLFAEAIRAQEIPVEEVSWRPPAGGDGELVRLLVANADIRARVSAANDKAVARMQAARPAWVDVRSLRDVLPDLPERTLFHSGPAIPWDRMCGPHHRAAAWTAVFEGWARNPDEASAAIAAGRIRLEPATPHSTVCPMATVIGPSAQVHVITDPATGATAYSPVNEGRERTIWNGNPDQSTVERLAWFRDELARSLSAALHEAGGVDLFGLFAQSLQMGDELHVRLPATTALLLRAVAGPMLEAGVAGPAAARAFRFLEENSLFGLPIVMGASRVAADLGHGIPDSSLVTGMNRNGIDFGLRVSGLGDRWLIAPAVPLTEAIYYSGYDISVAAGDIGDSAIVECAGLGGMAIAGAPTIAGFVGGSVSDELAVRDDMHEITLSTSQVFTVPATDFSGTPTGIDVRRVVETGIVPIIDTGAIHETDPEAGQIGAGIARAPIEVFRKALIELGVAWSR